MSGKLTNEQQLSEEGQCTERSKEAGEAWVGRIDDAVDLPEVMESVVRKQGTARNCAKPIGLFLGDDSIVAKQDKSMTRRFASDKERCRSFIESFQYFAGHRSSKEIPQEVLIPTITKILLASSLPIKLVVAEHWKLVDPECEHIEQYVENEYHYIAQDRNEDGSF